MLKLRKLNCPNLKLSRILCRYMSNKDNDVEVKSNIKDFKINFEKDVNFKEFSEQIDKNFEVASELKNISNISSEKLLEKIKIEGVDKTKEELELISKLATESKTEPLRYMALDDYAEKYRQKVGDQKMKFMMPIGWGWAFPFVKYTAMTLVACKTATGLPWLSFFVFCGVVVRLCFFPLVIRQMVLIHRMAKVSPNIRLLAFCTLKSNLSLFKKALYFTRAVWRYSKDVKVNPFVFAAYNLFQLPLFFLIVMSIRKISYEENLAGTGILWFKNLNESDPYLILPIASVMITYYNLGRGINKDNEHWFINRWRSFFQILQICYLPFTCMWPAGTHVYWITSTLLVNLQQTILKHPKVMTKINPSYYEDMQRVFQTERNKEDSTRYVEKLKKCEDPIIKSPTNNSKVLYELSYEKTRMNLYLKNLRYRKKIKTGTKSIINRIKELFAKKTNSEEDKSNRK